ncbi:MAG TPA: helix-turn-helix transcriptional regulator [Candidatus Nitrosotenuis sp.]|jgi:transcriptional regulator with XRE-family HTH domain|nr:helix-turn-helix transcriptional regulator [Candidatus Nitrosotenuis sp.]
MRNQAWANYVRDKRKARGLTRRKLAELAKIDPSYVTLIERDGYVPRKDKVLEIAKAIEADIDQTLLVAGYAPEKIPIRDLLERLENFKAERVLDRELRNSIRELFDLTTSEQKKVAEMLNAYVKTLRDQKKARGARARVRTTRGLKAQG